jgi:hypothetical protein
LSGGTLRRLAALLPHGRLQEVHGRAADETGDEAVAREIVELERRPHLLDAAPAHDHDGRAHGHGLDLVVGHVDHGGLEPLVELLQLGPHFNPQLGVQVGERLVEEENLRLAHDGPAESDALPLAAGELARFAVQQLV